MTDVIKVVRLEHAAGLPVPVRMTPGSSGCDICAAVTEDVIISPGARALVPTGFCFEIPIGFEIQVRPRSGLAIKYGITLLNTPGTIDADYRGEVKIILINLGSDDFKISRGDRIAQVVVAQVAHNTIFIESAEMESTSRGGGGFGHTGI
jgi:dUTP pyrophosphatase